MGRPATLVVMYRLFVVVAFVGCTAPISAQQPPAPPPGDGSVAHDAAPHVPGHPGAGAHGLAYYRLESHATTLATPAMNTHATGGTIIVSVGRGAFSGFVAPTDTRDNVYTQIDTAHTYTRWTTSGTALYAATDVSGGDGHVVRNAVPAGDEVTLAAVEVFDGTTIADASWTEVLAPPLTSASVTTTGPATLVAFWWGDAGASGDKTAVPGQGFHVVDAILDEGSLVQCAVAVREVAEPGTYDVTWTSTPEQGAQLWLIAVQ